ncbi:MAG: STAS domain-containing protein [Planctomycetaceae bacterium]
MTRQLAESNSFHVYKQGQLTIIGFDGKALTDPRQEIACRDELLRMIDHADCQILAVDLMQVPVISSWILGILAAIKQKGVQVELYHPNPQMRDVLSVTRLDELLHVRHDEVRPDATGNSAHLA